MGLHTFFSEVSTLPKKAPSPSARSRCLGFPPRSNSFAFEPTVQLRSIFSLSGLTRLTRVVRTEIRSNAEGGLILSENKYDSNKDSVQKLTKCQVLDGGCQRQLRSYRSGKQLKRS